MRIDAIAVTARDIANSVGFYELLGFEFKYEAEALHVEAKRREGEPRLMIDSAKLAEELIGVPPKAANHSSFALLCANPGEVDAIAKQIEEAGHQIVKAPWDAFWGQRYAVIADPDGYQIDLFAEL